MKRITYFILLLSITLLTNSCEENGIFFPSSNSDNIPIFEVTFDGGEFSTGIVNFVTDVEAIVITANKIDTDELFTIRVEDFGVGSFSFEGVNNVASYVENGRVSANIWTTFNETTSKGNIVFTDIDLVNNTVSGTFNFDGENEVDGSSKSFTNGRFSNIKVSDQPVTDDTFTAKVDGVLFEYISLFATPITIGSTDLISISANKSLYNTINFNLNADITPGEYDLGSFISQSYPTGQYTTSITDIYVADGKIIITSHDTSAKKIAGTFSFEAKDILSSTVAHTITEGSFSVSY